MSKYALATAVVIWVLCLIAVLNVLIPALTQRALEVLP